MRQLEREKAAAAGDVRDRCLAAFDTIERVIAELEAGRLPSPADRALLVAGWQRFAASRGQVKLEVAFGIEAASGGGRQCFDAVDERERNREFCAAYAEILPGLTPGAAAKRIFDAHFALRVGIFMPEDAQLLPYIKRALATGAGMVKRRQLDDILRSAPPRVHCMPPHRGPAGASPDGDATWITTNARSS